MADTLHTFIYRADGSAEETAVAEFWKASNPDDCLKIIGFEKSDDLGTDMDNFAMTVYRRVGNRGSDYAVSINVQNSWELVFAENLPALLRFLQANALLMIGAQIQSLRQDLGERLLNELKRRG
jgi:hypothetical protein